MTYQNVVQVNPEGLSRLIKLQGVVNCRDLGGMTNKQGKKIKPGMLFRSADLHNATDQDLAKLNDLGVGTDVDLRTELELLSKPDRMLESWDTEHLPVFRIVTLLDTEGNPFSTIEGFEKDTEFVMDAFYPNLLLTKRAIKTWKKFFQILLHAERGVLFHCTEGKDRTGIAAILIESALDLEEATIFNDYLETNNFVQQLIAQHVNRLNRDRPFEERIREDEIEFYAAEPSYFDSAKKAVEKYGGWKGYLKEVIGLDEQDFETLQNKYLEEAKA